MYNPPHRNSRICTYLKHFLVIFLISVIKETRKLLITPTRYNKNTQTTKAITRSITEMFLTFQRKQHLFRVAPAINYSAVKHNRNFSVRRFSIVMKTSVTYGSAHLMVHFDGTVHE